MATGPAAGTPKPAAGLLPSSPRHKSRSAVESHESIAGSRIPPNFPRMNNQRPVAEDLCGEDSTRSAVDACWTQMPQDDCRQFNGKPIDFIISADGKYIEGSGTLDSFRHPTQPGLCRLGIVVPVPGSPTPCELFLPPAAVATITETRWDQDRFVLTMADVEGPTNRRDERKDFQQQP